MMIMMTTTKLMAAVVVSFSIVATSSVSAQTMNAHPKITHSGAWTASIMDSGLDSTSYDGTGAEIIPFECNILSTFGYSVVAQKQGETGVLRIDVIVDNETKDTAQTEAAYGVVTLASEC
jgi:hypothetical protein